MTSSAENVPLWQPPDFDPASRSALGTITGVRSPSAAGWASGGAAAATAPRVTGASTSRPDWAPPALEERRPAPKQPTRSASERAWDEGYAAGHTAGREEGEAGVEGALRALGAVVQRLEDAEAEFAREREHNLAALSLVVARKLVQQEFEARPEVLQALVNRALELVPAGSAIEVRMHQADLESLVPGIEKLALEGRMPAVQWVGDASLSRGSFMIDSPARVIDGRVDSALRQLYERITHD